MATRAKKETKTPLQLQAEKIVKEGNLVGPSDVIVRLGGHGSSRRIRVDGAVATVVAMLSSEQASQLASQQQEQARA